MRYYFIGVNYEIVGHADVRIGHKPFAQTKPAIRSFTIMAKPLGRMAVDWRPFELELPDARPCPSDCEAEPRHSGRWLGEIR